MVRQGLVLLSDADVDAPDLPAVCTVSKDDQGDGGAYFIGQAAAAEGALWCDRAYFTGRPDVAWAVAKADRVTDAGGLFQLGNEQNLDLEGWAGDAADWLAFEAEVRAWADRPDRILAMPPSPGVPDWTSWVSDTGPYAVHAYGSFQQMRDVVDWYLDNRPGDVYVTECNFGAGNQADVDAWAHAELVPFLDWCASEPRVQMACYFAWAWDQSPTLPTSVDARGTAVEAVLRDWTPPANGGSMDEDWYAPAVARPIAHNYTPGRSGAPQVVAVVEHIADGLGSPFGWFDTPRTDGSSAHFWISRDGLVEQYRPLSDTCWSNGPICDPDLYNLSVAAIVATGVDPNAATVAIEHEGYSGDGLTPAQTEQSRLLTAWLCARYGLVLSRAAVIGHYQLDACTRSGCPGAGFPWAAVLGEEPDGPDDIDALRDQLWALAGQCEAAGYPWLGQGVKSVVALSKGDA